MVRPNTPSASARKVAQVKAPLMGADKLWPALSKARPDVIKAVEADVNVAMQSRYAQQIAGIFRSAEDDLLAVACEEMDGAAYAKKVDARREAVFRLFMAASVSKVRPSDQKVLDSVARMTAALHRARLPR